MSDIAIRVEGLGKLYRLGERESYRTLRESLTDTLRSPFRRVGKGAAKSQNDTLWALKDVSFDVKHGEVFGVIGRNGAGKSTLLKILSRITEPTEGRAEIHGRVGSLLEVGTGFHPELSGRENIFLNGAILGMRKTEILCKFDEIVAFAEVERFIDTPVKHYSSGMYLRLAFAVAAHLDPEILIVDEVLAVGDAQFQRKCLGKIGEVANLGRTVLLVSHNMQAVSTLTNRCLLLTEGRRGFLGSTPSAITEYLRAERSEESVYIASPDVHRPKITRVEVHTSEPNGTHKHGEPLEVSLEFSTPFPINCATVSFKVTDEMQQPIIHAWISDSDTAIGREQGAYQLRCRIPKTRLYMGSYRLTVYLAEYYGGERFEIVEDICPFEIVMYSMVRDRPWFPGACVYLEDFCWDVEHVELSVDAAQTAACS